MNDVGLIRSGNDSRQRPARLRQEPTIDLRLPSVRGRIMLPWRVTASGDELSAAEILYAARMVGARAGAFVVGGNVLRDNDWRGLLGELAELRPAPLAVCTTGEGVSTATIGALRALGVQRLQIPFHCGRQDAHDWLVGQPGALKTAHRAIRACRDAAMAVTAEVVLTRPTMSHLAETVEVLARSGVRTVCIRRLAQDDTTGTEFVPLSPRLGLLEESLERAAAVAIERRQRLILRDLPLCVAPRLRPLFAAPDSEAWVLSDGSVHARGDGGIGCPTCPGLPHCAGVPIDYARRFGWEEFIDPRSTVARLQEDVAAQQAVGTSEPQVFTWRGPHRVRCEACADAPAGSSPASPYESTRVVRARLVQAARYRPAALRLIGADLLAHPQAALLIFDAVRLFPHVEVAGEASAVVEWSELDLRRIKDLKRFDVALYGPDAATHDAHCGIPGAFAATLRGVEAIRSQTEIPVGAYAVIHDARTVPAFAEGWSRGVFPGTPRFRLSASGAVLEELVDCARALPPGSAQAALTAVLPRCLYDGATTADDLPVVMAEQRRIHAGRSLPYRPCGSDPIGAFEACPDDDGSCGLIGCPGTAVGWQRITRTKRWTVNT